MAARFTLELTAAGAAALLLLGGARGHAAASNQTVLSADAVVSAALQSARTGRKVVLVEFGASWCSWCRRFDAFVHAPDVSRIVADNYVVVNLTVQESDEKKALENPGGDEAMGRWGGAAAGLPFYVFLGADGRKIADSNGMPDGSNIGFPGNAKELELFLGLIDKTAPRLGAADRAKVVDYLHRVVPS